MIRRVMKLALFILPSVVLDMMILQWQLSSYCIQHDELRALVSTLKEKSRAHR
jgi:hypothetical protein